MVQRPNQAAQPFRATLVGVLRRCLLVFASLYCGDAIGRFVYSGGVFRPEAIDPLASMALLAGGLITPSVWWLSALVILAAGLYIARRLPWWTCIAIGAGGALLSYMVTGHWASR